MLILISVFKGSDGVLSFTFAIINISAVLFLETTIYCFSEKDKKFKNQKKNYL